MDSFFGAKHWRDEDHHPDSHLIRRTAVNYTIHRKSPVRLQQGCTIHAGVRRSYGLVRRLRCFILALDSLKGSPRTRGSLTSPTQIASVSDAKQADFADLSKNLDRFASVLRLRHLWVGTVHLLGYQDLV